MDRAVPPPSPGVPARGSSSLRQARSTRTVPVGPEQAATVSSAGRRTGGSARHHPRWPPELRAQRGWGGSGHPGLDPRVGGRHGSPAPRPVRGTPARRTPARRFAARFRRLQLGSSAVRSLSSLGSPRPVPSSDRQRNEGLGLSKARVPCLRAEELRESPSDPGEGGVRGLEDHTGRAG